MTEDQLRALIDELLGIGDCLTDILGHVLSSSLDGAVDDEDVEQVREAILCWHRIHRQCAEMLSQ